MKRPKVFAAVAAGGGLAFLLICCLPFVFAQGPPPGARGPIQFVQQPGRPRMARALAADGRGEDEPLADGVFLPPDRSAKRRLELSEQMVQEKRFGEAVRLLGSLLESPEDYFFKPNPDQSVYRSLKAEAGRLIAALPKEGRESYELQFGAQARQMLKQATAKGSLAELAEVSRQFFHTQAGQESTFLLGRHHLDQNRPLAAALCFDRVRSFGAASERLEPVLSLSLATAWVRATKTEKAKEALVRLKRAHPGAEVIVAGKPVKLFAGESQALAWLRETLGEQRAPRSAEAEQWALFRGDDSRNATSAGGPPLLNVRWRQRTADDRSVEKFVTKVRQDYLSQEIVAVPSCHPLAVDNVVLMRTAFALQAVDFHNGKLIWRYPTTDDSFEQFLKAGGTQQPSQSVQLFSGLDQRMWEDAVFGTLSSDGDQVYFVDDLGLGLNGSSLTTVMPNGRRLPVNARNTNHLAARELRTQGKLKWEVGGITGEDEPKLAGAFFLGPPLPLLGHLYALAEIKGQEIRLVVLSPQTGALEWSQQLAVVETPVTQDSYRRNAGAVPSFADGVLVCPTSAGAIVAIDLTTRSLLWGYQYPRVQQPMPDRFNAVRFAIYPGTERRANEHWIDGSITLCDGRALITPVESDQLYCLDLVDGKELWKQNRGNNLYVACIDRENVVLVGRNAVSAVKLADGEKAWPDVELPASAMPSGRGFYSGHDYYLPLTTAEVAKINLQPGRIESRSRSRSGTIPGNLVSYHGSILSQGVDFLDSYYQLDALKAQVAQTLKGSPDDPRALAELGEVKLDEGLLREAVDLFRRSYALNNDDTTRVQLVEGMLEGLRVDFAGCRETLGELDGLIRQREHRLAYLRLMGLGLQSAGEVLPAFETYLKLVDADAPATLEVIDNALTVRRSRWIHAQLDQLCISANAEQRRQIDVAVTARLTAAVAAQSTDGLRTFLDIFGTHPAAAAARSVLVERLGGNDLLECDALVRNLERSSSPERAGAGVARMAGLLRGVGRADLAAVYYRQLVGRFADIVCQDGKTGRQLVAALPPEGPLAKGLAPEKPWPNVSVTPREIQVAARGTPTRPPRLADLEIVGPTGPLFMDTTISLDFNAQVLLGQDGLGDKRFRIPIYEQHGRSATMNRFNGYSAPPLSYVSVSGGLLVLSMSNQVMAIDTMRGSANTANRILWTQDLSDQIGGFPTSQGIYSRPVVVPWGGTRSVPEDTVGRRYGSIGPMTDDGVYFQRLRDLYCVDPLTGRTVWSRKNVGLGNQLFGDEELLFVAPPGANHLASDPSSSNEDTQVLRASTGESLGMRRIAPFDRRMATVGRLVLSWESLANQHALQMRDLWQDETVWSHSVASGSKAALVSQEAVGVLQPDGKFSLISLADGKQLVEQQLEPEASLLGIFILRSRDQYFLVTNSAARNEPNAGVQPTPGGANYPLVNGRVYAFDRQTGQKSWPAPAAVSQYGLMVNQPSQLPVLVFVRQLHLPSATATRELKTSVLCIDKRSGRVAFESDQLPLPAGGIVELSGDAAAHTVTLTMAPKGIELTFSDEPPAKPVAK